MVVHNPNNWHWVDKNCLPWSKDYMNENVVNTSYEDDKFHFTVKSVDSISGDCDVTQRKGKTLCIYDMKLVFSIDGRKKDDDSKLSGSVSVNEFFHDQDEDEYFFEVTSENASEVKKLFVPVIKAKLMRFQSDLISAHAKDVQHSTTAQ